MTMDNGIEVKTWEDFGFKPIMDHDNPSQSDFSFKTMHVAGLNGTLDFGAEIEGKTGIEINLHKFGQESALSRSIDEVNRFFFDEFKQPRYIKTIFDYDSSRYVWLKIAESFTPNRKSLSKELKVSFVQFDDKKYSVHEAENIVWGSQVIDFRDNYTLGNTGAGAKDLQVTTNTTLRPHIDGLALMPYIVLQGTGTDVRFVCAGKTIIVGTFSSATIEIDTENYIVYRNGVEVVYDLDEFYFVPGQPVLIQGENMNFKLTFHYRDVYI